MLSHIECVTYLYVKLQDNVVSAWYCPICVRSLPFSDLRTKELKIFLSFDTIEHTKTTESSKKTEKTNLRTNKKILPNQSIK